MSSHPEPSPEDDVVEDFRAALNDLTSNARPEIDILTLIARENPEKALAISKVVQEHIKRVPPHRKLPAVYVLDSVVKNVGTPYTIYFGKKLYEIFMDAYASVDMTTRRRMDLMLRTWKDPLPGSLDRRPVFPVEATRPIENALIKARTNAMQMQQQFGRGSRPMPQNTPYRETPTPPGSRPPSQAHGYPTHTPDMNGAQPYNPPPTQQPPPGYPPYPNHQMPSRSTPQPAPSSNTFRPPPDMGAYGAQQMGNNADALKDEIQRLITALQIQTAASPHDPSLPEKLKLLLEVQRVLQTQNMRQEDLMLIRNQIAALAVTLRAPQAQTPTPVPPQPVAVAPKPAATPKVSLDSLFGPGTLATLMARGSATPQVSTPQPPPAVAAIPSPRPQATMGPKPAALPPSDPMELMNMLRRAGMLPAGPQTAASAPTPNASIPSLPFPLPIPGTPMSAFPPQPMTLDNLTRDIVLKTSSMKQFRPSLVPLLFESLGPQCTQCGRRFTKDEEGKQKKTAHMDWHFRVNQRMAEADKGVKQRGWLVDDKDWINTRETIDQDHVFQNGETDAQGGSASKAPKLEYIPVPDDPVLANSVCPICQEKFETRWLDDAQDFVWPDATKVGGRIYHASCHREATNDGGSTPMYGRNTPEPVLGKRKAEVRLSPPRKR
ncbi:hypothetical protein F4778DRAFT_462332 [Xylariomycetidae sp. FL2044]|nr:hypothetical protein F4778DRAFT_462332 [Xylariomycetidae sp. FL2044]